MIPHIMSICVPISVAGDWAREVAITLVPCLWVPPRELFGLCDHNTGLCRLGIINHGSSKMFYGLLFST